MPAAGEDDIGCVISYDAEAPEVDGTLVTPQDERHFAISLDWFEPMRIAPAATSVSWSAA